MMEVFEAFESELWPPSADTRRRPRLGRFLSWVLIFYSVGLELFRTCYAVIFRGSELVAKDRGDLLERLEGRLDHALLGFARASCKLIPRHGFSSQMGKMSWRNKGSRGRSLKLWKIATSLQNLSTGALAIL